MAATAVLAACVSVDPPQPAGGAPDVGDLDYLYKDGASSLVRQGAFLDPNVGGKGKAEIIRNRIGRQPVFAFGNSMGDLEMLQYATSGRYPSLGLILVHDDPDE